jgi:WD40 repeat protein
MKILLAFLLFVVCRSFTYNSVFTTQGHTNLVTTASFFLDGNRFITGSKDNKVKIWSLRNFSMLH